MVYFNMTDNYYLVNDEGLNNKSIEIMDPKKRCKPLKIMWISVLILFVLLLIGFFLVFVAFPLVFMNSLSLQQKLVFTNWNLESNRSYYDRFRFAGKQNRYVTIKDTNDATNLTLGVWHILPIPLAEKALNDTKYDYDDALMNSNFSVLLYFHGTGEARSDSQRKYQLFRLYFHVITFDYRSYADSSKGKLSEKSVVSDCVQVFKWLQKKTNSPIFVWGHSLGSALATHTLANLNNNGNVSGLILEAAFTSLKDELYVHPIIKYFSWMPWFKSTVVKPLQKNGFIFNNSHHVANIECPILFLHAKDDPVVPYFMSEKLYKVASKRNVNEAVKNDTSVILFDKYLGLNHIFIYQDSYVIFYIHYFMKQCVKDQL